MVLSGDERSMDTALIPAFVSGFMSNSNDFYGIPDACHLSDADDSTSANTSPSSRWEDNSINITTERCERYNFMVVGPTASGKSTFCSRLLRKYFQDKAEINEGTPSKQYFDRTSHIEERGRAERVQGSTRIIVTVVDTPGFGERYDPTNEQFGDIEQYIINQREKYEKNEVYRNLANQEDDTRIHCCFYFLTQSRVTLNDCIFMCKLQSKVPIVPIIPKADMMDDVELATQLRRINSLFNELPIQTFDFEEGKTIDTSWLSHQEPQHLEQPKHNDADSEYSEIISTLPRLPNVFAIISGYRRYRWGAVTEHDEHCCDTQRLFKLLYQGGSLAKLLNHTRKLHEDWRQAKKEAQLLEQKLIEEEEMERSQRSWFSEFQYRRAQNTSTVIPKEYFHGWLSDISERAQSATTNTKETANEWFSDFLDRSQTSTFSSSTTTTTKKESSLQEWFYDFFDRSTQTISKDSIHDTPSAKLHIRN